MKVAEVYSNHLYSIWYDGEELDEFRRLFEEWGDVCGLADFFESHREILERNPTWENTPELEAAAMKAADETDELRDQFDILCKNTENGTTPDFEEHFKWLDGEFRDVFEYVPMKSYGTQQPSFLRIYAIRIKRNVYLITGGGIKLEKKIKDSPGLKNHVITNIKAVRNWIVREGIMDNEDLEKLKED